MQVIYQIELYFKNGSSKVWDIWAFTTRKGAAEFGEYKFRTWDDVEYYRIREADINPKWFRLSNPNYKLM